MLDFGYRYRRCRLRPRAPLHRQPPPRGAHVAEADGVEVEALPRAS